MNTTPNTIYASYTMDFTAQVHHAMRADGQWFVRCQDRTSWGYRWSAWRKTSPQSPNVYQGTGRKARLPKE